MARIDDRIMSDLGKRLFNIGGPTGTGKDVVIKGLMKLHPSVSRFPRTTTRLPRPGEVDGQDYIFIDESRFKALLQRGSISAVDVYAGNLYGIDCQRLADCLVEDEHCTVVMIGGICGIQLMSDFPTITNIYLTATPEELRRRAMARGGDQRYIERSLKEAAERFDEEPKLFDVVINNPDDQLDETIRRVAEIMKLVNGSDS